MRDVRLDDTVRIEGPAEVPFGQPVTFRTLGLAAQEEFTVSLAPTRHRGGNCCGSDVDEGHANADGVAVLRFRWPAHYRNGTQRVRWRDRTRADVIVFGDAGRGIKTVRVRRYPGALGGATAHGIPALRRSRRATPDD